MKLLKLTCVFLLVALMMQLASAADLINIQLTTVGDPGNLPDSRFVSPGYGGVANAFSMGKTEVTAEQYTTFLNAVATQSDIYGLYNTRMADTANFYGCNIQRTNDAGVLSYSVDADWANRPVNYVSWGDAARFCNWLQNGQKTAAVDPNTTETGAYTLDGKTSWTDLASITRTTDAQYVIPSENEWYKAAYYDPNKIASGTGGYWTYPTKSDSIPANVLDPAVANSANFYITDFTIGSPMYRTDAGAFTLSPSAYGTFDQGGNVWELTDTIDGYYRVERGGSFDSGDGDLKASSRIFSSPVSEYYDFGFRVALVPEPGILVMLAGIAVFGLFYSRRR